MNLKSKNKIDISELKNIGPRASELLRACSINTLYDLETLGSIDSFIKIYLKGYNVTIKLLYSIEGAINDIYYSELTENRKKSLKNEVNLRLYNIKILMD